MNPSVIHYLNLIGFTLDIIGKVLVSYTAIAVHNRFWKEHKVDERVFDKMKSERLVGISGVLLMIAGYCLQMIYKLTTQ